MENEISKYYKDCHNCSYFRHFSYKYNVNEPFCTKYLQKISEIKICEKITRHRSYIKTDKQMKKYKRNKFNERLEYGFKLLSENKDYKD